MMMIDSKTSFYCSKFPWTRQIIVSGNIENLDVLFEKGSPVLTYILKPFKAEW
jgi:hypothetical protein